MKKLIYSLVLASSVLCIGCNKEESTPAEPPKAAVKAAEAAVKAAEAAKKAAEAAGALTSSESVPTSSEYRALLDGRKASVGGANINILQEVSKFENATDEEKRNLYKKVKELVK